MVRRRHARPGTAKSRTWDDRAVTEGSTIVVITKLRTPRLLVAGLLLLAACGSVDSAGDSVAGDPAAGDPAGKAQAEAERLPALSIDSLTGGDVIRLSDIEGPAVVNLWATWCAPCRAEIPHFEEVHQARSDEVTFIGVNVGEGSDDAAAFIDEVGATYGQFLDSGGEVAVALRATSMPLTVVINGDGVVTTRHLGPLDQSGLNEAIDEALSS
jgi:thiol-disulfide isomerase/thioredoxin